MNVCENSRMVIDSYDKYDMTTSKQTAVTDRIILKKMNLKSKVNDISPLMQIDPCVNYIESECQI